MDKRSTRRTAEHLALQAIARSDQSEAGASVEDLADRIVNQDRRIPREVALEAVQALR
jgi:hypothetical protein